jgi:hypothetical protein
MRVEIIFNLTPEQKEACANANIAYHKVALEDNDFQYADAKEIYEALMRAWEFISEVDGDWIQ